MTLPMPETLGLLARIALIVAGFVAYALLAARWHRSAQRDSARLFEQVDLALTGLRELSEGVAALEARLGGLATRVETSMQAPLPAGEARGSRNYEIALRLARNGASGADLQASCGLTANEAALLVRLHGLRKSPTPVRASAHSEPVRLQPEAQAADMSPR